MLRQSRGGASQIRRRVGQSQIPRGDRVQREPRIADEADARRREIEAFDAETAELDLRAKQKAARDARYAARKQRR